MAEFNWRCWLGFHPWDKWSATRRMDAKVVSAYKPDVEFTQYLQDRICPMCGKHQRREVIP